MSIDREEIQFEFPIVFDALKQLLRQYKDTDFNHILESSYKIKTHDDLRRWTLALAVAAVELAKPTAEAYDKVPRAREGPQVACPLCGYKSGKPNADGYKWPEGLKRHFTGEGNTKWCDVTRALSWLQLQLLYESTPF